MHPYTPLPAPPAGPFIVLEGASGIGKSTLARILTERLGGHMLHTLPEPLNPMAPLVNATLRPLPQFGFYLAGVLHASDLVREFLPHGPVVADRYVSSMTACHAAVHGVDVKDVSQLLEPFQPYLIRPDHTFYLRCSDPVLHERIAGKADFKQDDLELLQVPGRLARLLENFETVAAADPSATVLATDGLSPDLLADHILHQIGAAHA
ncbi:dTMP kinase [Streptacidiphilus sp. EB129]|uniref:dTMP kinase n=1 Tax=Streptacidiphilus sp. EB129 TaxID=3156262 RepID=UPI003515A49D